MTVEEIMTQLEALGSESTKKVLLKHGMKEPFFGVKIGDMKPIEKKIKKDYQLAKELYATGNADAMYLAGLIADDEKMTEADLNKWVKAAASANICEYTVPWVAAGSKHGMQLALKWIDAKEPNIATAGWATLANIASLIPDEKLDLSVFKNLLLRVAKDIHTAPNRVRYSMNTFIICVGSYIPSLTKEVEATAKQIGTVMVDMNGTACKVPDALMYIKKVANRGNLGKKKKTVKC